MTQGYDAERSSAIAQGLRVFELEEEVKTLVADIHEIKAHMNQDQKALIEKNQELRRQIKELKGEIAYYKLEKGIENGSERTATRVD